MFDEVQDLVEEHPSNFGPKGAFAQAYSLFDAALGVATVVGPGLSGALLQYTSWQITAGSLAIMCAVGAVPVLLFTGKKAKHKQNHDEL